MKTISRRYYYNMRSRAHRAEKRVDMLRTAIAEFIGEFAEICRDDDDDLADAVERLRRAFAEADGTDDVAAGVGRD